MRYVHFIKKKKNVYMCIYANKNCQIKNCNIKDNMNYLYLLSGYIFDRQKRQSMPYYP